MSSAIPSAVTANVWGQGRAAQQLATQAASLVRDAEEECMICRDDVPATIAFVPCSHRVCFACVENMRAKNIFRADKGLKCPFCRTYVDGYKTLLQPTPEVHKFLTEANKAAKIAATARLNEERKQQGNLLQAARANLPRTTTEVPAAAASSGEDVTWRCACGASNLSWKEQCTRCRRPNPSPMSAQPLAHTRVDIASASAGELVAYLHDKGAFPLLRSFLDCGMTYRAGENSVKGSVASIREAMSVLGPRRLLAVVDKLSDPAVLREASLHQMGNFGVQRLLDACGRLRGAYPLVPGTTGAPLPPLLAQWVQQHDGKDPLGVLLDAMLPNLLEFCLHDKGTYVVQRFATSATNADLVRLFTNLVPLAIPVSRDTKGIFCMLNILDLFQQRLWGDPVNCEAGLAVVDQLCQVFLSNDKQLLFMAHHNMTGRMLVRAIAVALPRIHALKLASRIASLAGALVHSTSGPSTLVELLTLYGHNPENCILLRDVFCNLAFALQGSFAKLALSENEDVPQVLALLVERLREEQEVHWLDGIVQELVGAVDALVNAPQALDILVTALSTNIMALEDITLHIKDMKSVLGKAAVVPVVTSIMEGIARNGPAPAPKYTSPCVIQPDVRYYLGKGAPLGLPPAPPPGPKPQPAPRQQQQQSRPQPAQQAAPPQQQHQQQQQQPAAWGAPARPPASAADTSWADSSGSSWATQGPSPAAAAAANALAPMGQQQQPQQPHLNGTTAPGPPGFPAAASAAAAAPAAAVPRPVPVAMPVPMPMPVPVPVPAAAPAGPPGGLPAAAVPRPVPVPMPMPVPVPVPVPAPAAAGSGPLGAGPAAAAAVPVPVPVPRPMPVPVPVPRPVPVPMPAPAVVMQQQQQTVPGVPTAHAPPDFHSRAPAGTPAAPPVPRPVAVPPRPAAQPPLSPGAAAAVAAVAAASLTPQEAAWPLPQQAPLLAQRQQVAQQQEVAASWMGAAAAPRPAAAAAAAAPSADVGGTALRRPPGSDATQAGLATLAAANAPAATGPARAWDCGVCTYRHDGPEAEFLLCAVCGAEKRG